MDIDEFTVCEAVQLLYKDWHWIKDTVVDFGYKDYMKRVHGIEYYGQNIQTFGYKVLDEQKFMWFMMKYGNRND